MGQGREMVSGWFKHITFIVHFISNLMLLLIWQEVSICGPEVFFYQMMSDWLCSGFFSCSQLCRFVIGFIDCISGVFSHTWSGQMRGWLPREVKDTSLVFMPNIYPSDRPEFNWRLVEWVSQIRHSSCLPGIHQPAKNQLDNYHTGLTCPRKEAAQRRGIWGSTTCRGNWRAKSLSEQSLWI